VRVCVQCMRVYVSVYVSTVFNFFERSVYVLRRKKSLSSMKYKYVFINQHV
jgi:hypothetical protein